MKLADRYAHRGFHNKPEIPENSIPAFRRAIEHGWGIEFDVHLIADGSLVVFHDESLKRETGVVGEIEDYDVTNLKKLRLEGTDEQIPTFDEVLELVENNPGPDGRSIPLLIELKVARGNYRELAAAVCKRLDSYSGNFVIESFDPRALIALRKLRPAIARGQLTQNFIKHPQDLPIYQRIALSHMMFNPLTKPDFIAFRFSDGINSGTRKRLSNRGVKFAAWTIKDIETYKRCINEGCSPIFEQFNPDKYE